MALAHGPKYTKALPEEAGLSDVAAYGDCDWCEFPRRLERRFNKECGELFSCGCEEDTFTPHEDPVACEREVAKTELICTNPQCQKIVVQNPCRSDHFRTCYIFHG
ncbi:uncharacterized protein MELLADRAFT_106925 [Melampsora larici-populina 98AG31]|uniref:Uncharacterized protein n=1 Tax=Melampsora larici-populina (strain 98AG31 / pathotype 3-4-7) TaxID=747676 RepID=F4RN32_MELLP|nr:uncharacterized protein MELLADRAFT_106925 [Melampsora larici-populina 98AG31]EGG06227.1 hypothetical protein MELLADRAFT_106925 [Melampsora larici-populina 98AG31]